MDHSSTSPSLDALVGQLVILDLRSSYTLSEKFMPFA